MQVFVQPEILIDGEKPISIYSRIEISYIPNGISSFLVSIPTANDLDVATFFNKNKQLLGKPVTLILKSGKKKEDQLVFVGFIGKISFSKNQGLSPDLVIESFDPSKLMDGTPSTRCFRDVTADDIFRQVTSKYPKNGMKITTSNVRKSRKYEYITQYKETDYNFLRRVAYETGNWFFYNGRELFFGNPQKNSEKKVYLGNTLTDFQIDFNTQAFKSKTQVYNYRTSSNFEYETKESDLKSTGNKLTQDLITSSSQIFATGSKINKGDQYTDLKELQDQAKVEGESIVSELIILSGRGRDPSLVPGNFISVFSPIVSEETGISGDHKRGDVSYGSYLIYASQYEIQQGGELFSSFKAVSASVTAPPSDDNFTFPICENQPAEVVENNDPDGLGRIKVRFFWHEPNDMTPWIRTAQLMAGKDYGFYGVPEIGDQVLVGFEDNNPDKPFTIGSVYNKEANQKEYNKEGNIIKSFKTKSGNEIKFNDKGGEEEILITSPGGENAITLSVKDKIITIVSENIHLQAKKITLDGEDNVEIKSKKITIEGQNEVNIKGNKIEATANNACKVASSNSLELKGLTAKLEASTELGVKGGVMAKLEGGAQTVVKGGIVMIN